MQNEISFKKRGASPKKGAAVSKKKNSSPKKGVVANKKGNDNNKDRIFPKLNLKEKIAKAALDLLGKEGIQSVTQPKVAKKVGVPQGHLTYYFPTRSDLLMEVADRSLSEIAKSVIQSSVSDSGRHQQNNFKIAIPIIEDVSRTRMLLGLAVEADTNQKLSQKLAEQIQFSRTLIAMAQDIPEDSIYTDIINATLIGLGVQFYLAEGVSAASKKKKSTSSVEVQNKSENKSDRIEKILATLAAFVDRAKTETEQ